MDKKFSSIFALFWQMAWSRLPQEIIDDFDIFLGAAGIRRMDANGRLSDGSSTGSYSVTAGDATFDFHAAELAPPAGVFAQNYSQWAAHILYIYIFTKLIQSNSQRDSASSL